MTKKTLFVLMLLALTASLVACGREATKAQAAQGQGTAANASHSQALCPIMGGKINPKQYTDVLGQRIYVCCPGCKAKIKADPEKALATLASRGEHAESLQKLCPILGKPIDKALFVEYAGRRIYACCAGCLPKIKKDPALYAKKVADALSQGAK